jgi:hypothetical protein
MSRPAFRKAAKVQDYLTANRPCQPPQADESKADSRAHTHLSAAFMANRNLV